MARIGRLGKILYDFNYSQAIKVIYNFIVPPSGVLLDIAKDWAALLLTDIQMGNSVWMAKFPIVRPFLGRTVAFAFL